MPPFPASTTGKWPANFNLVPMSSRNGLIVILLLCLTAIACRKDNIEEAPEAFCRVSLLESSVNIPSGGSARILFRASDVALPMDVSLRLRDGSVPQSLRVTDVSREAGADVYSAIISDNGNSPAYSYEVFLDISSGGMRYVTTDYICVNCGTAEFPMRLDTGLPVVYIDTDGARPVESKDIELAAVMKIQGAGGYGSLQPASCNVKGRGNINWNFDKKPLKVTFRDRVSLLGLPEGSTWVLLANFVDRTLMRNLVAMKVSSLTSLAWTPRCVPVELVLNGNHEGSYLLIEQVEVDENRVDVSREDGFLLEVDFHYDNEVQWLDPHGFGYMLAGTPFAVKYPSPGALDAAKESYIKEYVSQTANVLYSAGFADPAKGYGKWINVDSFVDYWIVNELLGNPDLSTPGSIYFHKEGGGKLVAGPCWDFDWCLTDYGTTIQEWAGSLNENAFWYARLFKDPEFKRRVGQRIAELLPELQGVADYIDDCGRQLAASAELNFALWNPAVDRWRNKGLLINGDEKLTFEQAVVRLRQVYLRRLALMEKYCKD